MLAYRFENPDNGLGPYFHYDNPKNHTGVKGKLAYKLAEHHCNDSEGKYPGPDEEHFEYDRELIFGCPSLESLCKWFSGYVEELLACGFQIRVYNIKEAKSYFMGKSKKQVAFYLKNAELVETIDSYEKVLSLISCVLEPSTKEVCRDKVTNC